MNNTITSESSCKKLRKHFEKLRRKMSQKFQVNGTSNPSSAAGGKIHLKVLQITAEGLYVVKWQME